jgi:hypothetical protein
VGYAIKFKISGFTGRFLRKRGTVPPIPAYPETVLFVNILAAFGYFMHTAVTMLDNGIVYD